MSTLWINYCRRDKKTNLPIEVAVPKNPKNVLPTADGLAIMYPPQLEDGVAYPPQRVCCNMALDPNNIAHVDLVNKLPSGTIFYDNVTGRHYIRA